MTPPLPASREPSNAPVDASTRLPSPEELRSRHPLSPSAELFVRETRGRIRHRIEDGRGPAIAIVGPCSLHSEAAAHAYAELLAHVADRLADDLIVVMRAYFEKPRTTVGWKGFLYDPNLDGSDQLPDGLARGRRLLTTLAQRKLALATEILDPLTSDYFEDCLSWVAIGARTTESQIHRQTASRLPCAVGFKNGTDGSVDVALAAILAAREKHTHLGIDRSGHVAVLTSPGNPLGHLVLRGGKKGPNYDFDSIGEVGRSATKFGVRPQVLVDASHGNSGKDPRRQVNVVESVCDQLARSDVDVLGVMIESHVREGAQPASPEADSERSVTDACLDFASTERLLERLAGAARRAGR